MAVSDESLRHAQTIAAEIVALHGSTFSPILKVLNDEIRRREQEAKELGAVLGDFDFEEARLARRRAYRKRLRDCQRKHSLRR